MLRKLKSNAFNETPDDLAWRIRDTWLGNVEEGLNPVQDEFIPVLEMEAARVLRSDPLIRHDSEPSCRDDSESWRLWWMNEALHLSSHGGSTADAAYHLPTTSRHAVNVLNAASELRDAMEEKDVERTALFAMLLAMEALQGGYSIDHEAAKDGLEKRQKKIGEINAQYAKVKSACVRKAAAIWLDDPSKRIGEVAQALWDALCNLKAKGRKDVVLPTVEKIREWLIDAEKQGKLSIPPQARKGGRPKNK